MLWRALPRLRLPGLNFSLSLSIGITQWVNIWIKVHKNHSFLHFAGFAIASHSSRWLCNHLNTLYWLHCFSPLCVSPLSSIIQALFEQKDWRFPLLLLGEKNGGSNQSKEKKKKESISFALMLVPLSVVQHGMFDA